MIRHHLPDTMLLDHAAGTLPPAVPTLVATHLTLCPTCRGMLAVLEGLAGQMLAGLPPVDGDDEAGLAALLERLDEPEPEPTVLLPAWNDGGEFLLPAPLRRLTGPSANLQWRPSAPGIGRRVALTEELGGIASTLEEVWAGKEVPNHGHRGIEITLVLAGGYTDEQGHYGRGDVQVVGPETVHGLQIDDDGEPCLLLSVRSAARVPHGLKARIASWIGAI